jgi:hypothetical protein
MGMNNGSRSLLVRLCLLSSMVLSKPELLLHQRCLSLLGILLGELWDLKALAHACRAGRQYSFLVTSSPLNFPGAVASPAERTGHSVTKWIYFTTQ